MTRTDAHRPAVVDPGQYEYVGVFYQGGAWSEEGMDRVACYLEQDSVEQVEAAEKLLEEQPFHGNHYHRGTCDHCGTRFAYGVVYRHKPTGDGIAVGHTCSYQTFGYNSRRDLEVKRLKGRVAAARERAKVQAAADTFRASVPGLAEALAGDHYLLQKFSMNLNTYGSLSEKQVACALKVHREEQEKKARKAQEDAELPAPAPVVEGRQVVTGILLGIRDQESDWGVVDKMLVVDDRGFKVWCTVPEALWEIGRDGAKRDDADCARKWLIRKRVSFTVTVEKSRKDECFGFGKRPTKPSVIE